MKQALHIFKKDVRYLRVELTVSLLFMALFIYAMFSRAVLKENAALIADLLLLCVWAFLSARLIQAEPIPGDRQFWITRPYEWRSLLGAKLLFMLVFMSIPMLVVDAIVLGMRGFSIPAHLPGLVLSMILITCGALIVFCAFAALSRGLTEWMLSGIVAVGLLLALEAMGKEGVWRGVQWMRDYGYVAMLFVTALAVLLGQYRWRRTVVSIVVMAVGLLGSSLYAHYASPAFALELEARFSKRQVDPSGVRVTARAPSGRVIPLPEQHDSREGVVLLAIPLDVSGLDESRDLIGDGIGVAIRNESGAVSSFQNRGDSGLRHLPTGYRLQFLVDRAAFEKMKHGPVGLSLTLYLTLLGNPVSKEVRLGAGAVDVPGVGRCADFAEDGNDWIDCESPLRQPSKYLAVQFGDRSRDRFFTGTSYSPFPADADSAIIPVSRYFHSGPPNAPATLTTLEPLAHFRRDLDLRAVYLADYQQ